jgi:hypothetical protein
MPVVSIALNGGYRISRLRDLLSNMGSTLYRLKPLSLYPAPRNKAEILHILSRTHDEISKQVLAWREEEHSGIDIGRPSRVFPVTPPYMRVRIRRFDRK